MINVRIRKNTSEWFDAEISEKIHTRHKLNRKFKFTKLHADGDKYKEAQNAIQCLIRKTAFFEEKLKANTANPK